MNADKSTRRRQRGEASGRPPKPYADFPLYAHPLGYWAKKIRGRIYYFGRWGRQVDGRMVRQPGDGWKEALAEYQRVRDDLYAGRPPRPPSDGLTVADLCNHFLTSKQRLLDSGEIVSRTFRDYHEVCGLLVRHLGREQLVENVTPTDFEQLRAVLADSVGPVRLGNLIQRVRSVFKYGYEAGLLDRPVRFGPQFKRPPASVLRRHRNAAGPKMFEAEEIRRLLEAAKQPLHAMILLGVNAGYGNHDCATLPRSAVNWKTGWVDFPRPKTAIARRCWLWPETRAALRDALAQRPRPRDAEAQALVFVTRRGAPWFRASTDNPISKEFRKLLNVTGLHRRHRGFYALRHTFETIAGETLDQPAVDLIMGHAPPANDMAAVYRERISDDRLLRVARHVHRWLFGPSASSREA